MHHCAQTLPVTDDRRPTNDRVTHNTTQLLQFATDNTHIATNNKQQQRNNVASKRSRKFAASSYLATLSEPQIVHFHFREFLGTLRHSHRASQMFKCVTVYYDKVPNPQPKLDSCTATHSLSVARPQQTEAHNA